MKIKDFHELFIINIKDLYSAETQLIEALPKMAEKASNEQLRKGFEEHLKQTQEHAKRLEKIAENLDFNPKNHTCKGMQGIIEEGAEFLKAEGDDAVVDAGLIGAAQRVEHYEIAGYGTAVAMAKLMGHDDEADLLEETLNEEKETDEKLTQLAEEEVNPEAGEKME